MESRQTSEQSGHSGCTANWMFFKAKTLPTLGLHLVLHFLDKKRDLPVEKAFGSVCWSRVGPPAEL